MKPSDRALRRLGLSFVTELSGIQEYRLNANSLKILLAPNPASRAAAIVQHVRVGSRHEGAGNTGYSHLLEHILFKGTPQFNKDKGNSYDDFMNLMGGNCNATTSSDRTNYYGKVPSAFIRQYLAYEADRLRNAFITDADLRTEMPVVVDEFDIGENDPEQLAFKQLNATMYNEHPYKIDTIGARSEVLKVTAAALKERLYDQYYWPNNTTLIVVGGFEEEKVLRDIVDLYAEIPSSPKPIPIPYTVEPKQFGERRYRIRKPGDLPLVLLGYHTPEADHDDTYALVALSLILGETESSRLTRKLIDKGRVATAWSWHNASHDPGQLVAYAQLLPGTTPEAVEQLLLAQIEDLTTKLVSRRELETVKELVANKAVLDRSNQLKFALSISEHEAVADWKWGQEFAANLAMVTRQDIRRVAQRYLHEDNRTVGYFEPSGQSEPPAPKEQKKPAPDLDGGERKRLVIPCPVESTTFVSDVQRAVLDNGMTVLLLPTNDEAVGVQLTVNAGDYCAPKDKDLVPYLVNELLQSGSKKYSKDDIAEFASRLGVSLYFYGEATETKSGDLVPSHLPEYLDILADMVRNPRFRAKEFKQATTILGAELESWNSDPTVRAQIALSQALYERTDRRFNPSVEELQAQLKTIELEDLRSFHRQAFGPKDAVLTLVGKFEPDAMLALIKSLFGSWSGGVDRAAKLETAAREIEAKRVDVQIDGKDNLTVMVGLSADLTVGDGDYLAAIVANKALGGDTLNSRLGLEIREKRGLTYGVNSAFAATPGEGPWSVSMTTNSGNLSLALPLIEKVVNQLVADGIGTNELAAEKISLSTSFDLRLDGPQAIAKVLSQFERSRQGLPNIDNLQQRLAAVTKEQVDAAIRKYFQLDKAVTVVAGNLPAAVN